MRPAARPRPRGQVPGHAPAREDAGAPMGAFNSPKTISARSAVKEIFQSRQRQLNLLVIESIQPSLTGISPARSSSYQRPLGLRPPSL